MTTRTTASDLARDLEAELPPLTDGDRRLARRVARLLARQAKPLAADRIVEAAARPERKVPFLLDEAIGIESICPIDAVFQLAAQTLAASLVPADR